MSESIVAPAQTYNLNVMASVLGRFAVPDIDSETRAQAAGMLDETLDSLLVPGVPAVPHSNQELLGEAIAFDQKLRRQLSNGPAGEQLDDMTRRVAMKLVITHEEECERLAGMTLPRAELFVDPVDIAQAYGLDDLWTGSDGVIREEAARWLQYAAHPPLNADLRKPVELGETRALMQLMWRDVICAQRYPDVRTYLTDDTDNYHVYWAPLANTLDYATPRSYDRATQLSFDLPHNATHLAHLDALDAGQGTARYNDDMAQRAYFEAVTVFSEYQTIAAAQQSTNFRAELTDILQPAGMSEDELGEWVAADRGYEFKLRAARYAADVLMIEGADFRDTTAEIARTFGITSVDAEKETRKYLPWTGLGAVYTFGYRQLLAAGVKRVSDAITNGNGKPIASWRDF